MKKSKEEVKNGIYDSTTTVGNKEKEKKRDKLSAKVKRGKMMRERELSVKF